MSKVFKAEEVAAHKKPDDLYIIVDQDVYDLTQFQDEHPGGKKSALIHFVRCHKIHSLTA